MVTSTTGRSKAERGKSEKKQGKKQKSELQEVWEAHGENEALGGRCYNLPWPGEAQEDTDRHQKKHESC